MVRNTLGTSETVSAHVWALRIERGWSRRRVAGLCTTAGASWLTEKVLYDLETGRGNGVRRPVSVDELMVFARIFQTHPLALLVGEQGEGDGLDRAGLLNALRDVVETWVGTDAKPDGEGQGNAR